MSSAITTASAVEIRDDDPEVLSVNFECKSSGPYSFISLERPYQPKVGDSRYSPSEVSLDLDLRPLANLGCTPSAVRRARLSLGRIVLELRGGLDAEFGGLRVMEIRYLADERLHERLRTVLEVMFDGTSTALETQDTEPDASPVPRGM